MSFLVICGRKPLFFSNNSIWNILVKGAGLFTHSVLRLSSRTLRLISSKKFSTFVNSTQRFSTGKNSIRVDAHKNAHLYFGASLRNNVKYSYNIKSSAPRRLYTTPMNNVEAAPVLSQVTALPTLNTITEISPAAAGNIVSDSTTVFELDEPTLINNLSDSILKIGDFKAMGLVHYTPVGAIEAFFEALYVYSGLPWWGTIIAATCVMRLILLPFAIKTHRNTVKLQNMQPTAQKMIEEIKSAHNSGDKMTVLAKSQQLQQIYASNGVSPFKSVIFPILQAPVMLSFFLALRNIANIPVPGYKEGGILWFTDLSVTDPYYMLPVVSSVALLAMIEFNSKMTPQNSEMSTSKWFLRGLGLISIPVAAYLPSGTLLYFATSSFISLGQFFLLNNPRVRQAFDIPPSQLRKVPSTPFMEQFKDLLADKEKKSEAVEVVRRKRRR
ncbi:hypothetical protein G9A89_020758 [Geosiphon pyriformis]|nr:hypothetical protein G9A89_020758 [Geosiphon pyriformis]